ncbi:MAG: hypothetical protein ABI200_02355 [Gaiellales bacterium]
MFFLCFMLLPAIGGVLYMAFDGDSRRERGELLWACGNAPPAEYLAQQAAKRGAAPKETKQAPEAATSAVTI